MHSRNHTEHNKTSINSDTQDTTEFHSNVFVTRIHNLLVINTLREDLRTTAKVKANLLCR
jgi:hypothetical protein